MRNYIFNNLYENCMNTLMLDALVFEYGWCTLMRGMLRISLRQHCSPADVKGIHHEAEPNTLALAGWHCVCVCAWVCDVYMRYEYNNNYAHRMCTVIVVKYHIKFRSALSLSLHALSTMHYGVMLCPVCTNFMHTYGDKHGPRHRRGRQCLRRRLRRRRCQKKAENNREKL